MYSDRASLPAAFDDWLTQVGPGGLAVGPALGSCKDGLPRVMPILRSAFLPYSESRDSSSTMSMA